MTLFTGRDAQNNLLTLFYQVKIEHIKDTGGELYEFLQQTTGALFPAGHDYVSRREIGDAIELQQFVRRFMEELQAVKKVNIGVLATINAMMMSVMPRFVYSFSEESFEAWTHHSYRDPEERGMANARLTAHGPKFLGHDLTPYYVPLRDVSVDWRSETPYQILKGKITNALSDAIVEQREVALCDSCLNPFIVMRPDQRYCSHRHAARESARKKRSERAAVEA